MALTKVSDLNLINMPDCTGLLENGRCSRLSITSCIGFACPLKSTITEMTASQNRTMARLRTLDEKTQDKIARKYYGGRQVWKEDRVSYRGNL